MKRILLLILTNLAVLLVLGLTTGLLGLHSYFTAQGLNVGMLLGFCAVFGFGGAFISLWLSRPIAKWSMRARVITGAEGEVEAWLVRTVQALAERARIKMPEVAIYDGEPNAFATGASRNASLVAVSTGLLQRMNRKQVEAVLAHEVAHVANGDMVTLTLVQGVMNTFVMFLARLIGYVIDRGVLKHEGNGPGLGYLLTVTVLELLLGVAAAIVVAKVSRLREYRADAGAARLLGTPVPMIEALQMLNTLSENTLPKNMAAFGINGGRSNWLSLFATHPPIESRIDALRAY